MLDGAAAVVAARHRLGIGGTESPVHQASRPPKPLGVSFPLPGQPQFLPKPRQPVPYLWQVGPKGESVGGLDPTLFFCGAAVHSNPSVLPRPPHLVREWRERRGTPNRQVFAFSNRLQRFVNSLQQLRQSARVCNTLQQIATATGSEDGLQTAKRPVVEHKGSSDDVVDSVLYLARAKPLCVSDDQGSCLPLRPTACFSSEITSQSASVIPF
jgi:hypothetical protein